MKESNDFVIHTGSILQEYLESRGISQKDAAMCMGTTTKHLSNIIRGKSALTTNMAIALENVMPDIPASYWINYEGRYQEYKAKHPAYHNVPADKLSDYRKRFHFKDIFKGTSLSDLEMAVKMLSILQINQFEDFSSSRLTQAVFFRDEGEQEAAEIWIRLCLSEIAGQNASDIPKFDIEQLKNRLNVLRDLSLNSDTEQSLQDCLFILNQLGIRMAFREPLPNSGVRGASLLYEDAPAILYSKRFRTHDQIWFAIAHEIGHIMNGDISSKAMIALEETYENNADKEGAANEFARRFFISDKDYAAILDEIKVVPKERLVSTIRRLAAKYEIHPGILSGRLARDNVVTYPEVSALRK